MRLHEKLFRLSAASAACSTVVPATVVALATAVYLQGSQMVDKGLLDGRVSGTERVAGSERASSSRRERTSTLKINIY
jgi:hypothetical protein